MRLSEANEGIEIRQQKTAESKGYIENMQSVMNGNGMSQLFSGNC